MPSAAREVDAGVDLHVVQDRVEPRPVRRGDDAEAGADHLAGALRRVLALGQLGREVDDPGRERAGLARPSPGTGACPRAPPSWPASKAACAGRDHRVDLLLRRLRHRGLAATAASRAAAAAARAASWRRAGRRQGGLGVDRGRRGPPRGRRASRCRRCRRSAGRRAGRRAGSAWWRRARAPTRPSARCSGTPSGPAGRGPARGRAMRGSTTARSRVARCSASTEASSSVCAASSAALACCELGLRRPAARPARPRGRPWPWPGPWRRRPARPRRGRRPRPAAASPRRASAAASARASAAFGLRLRRSAWVRSSRPSVLPVAWRTASAAGGRAGRRRRPGRPRAEQRGTPRRRRPRPSPRRAATGTARIMLPHPWCCRRTRRRACPRGPW